MKIVRMATLLATSVILTTTLTACQNDAKDPFTNVHEGGPVVADNTWLLVNPDTQGTEKAEYLPSACPTSASPTQPPVQTNVEAKSDASGKSSTPKTLEQWTAADYPQMQLCADAMKQLVDVRFGHYEDSLHRAVSNGNLAADTAVIGLSTAGGLLGGATTKILSLVSAGITGVKAKVDEDLLYNTSIEVILNQMHTNRATWATIIENRMAETKKAYDKLPPNTSGGTVDDKADKKNDGQQTAAQNGDVQTDKDKAEPYNNMYEVANDLFAYDRAGSWTEALASLKNQTAAQATACEAKRKAKKGGTTDSTTDQEDKVCPSIKSGKKKPDDNNSPQNPPENPKGGKKPAHKAPAKPQ